MTADNSEAKFGELSEEQTSILQGFVDHYTDASNATPTLTGYYDLASANVRQSLQEDFGLSLDSPEEYYRVMVGLSIGTVWVEGLVGEGLALKDAAEVMRTSLARLFPTGPEPELPKL